MIRDLSLLICFCFVCSMLLGADFSRQKKSFKQGVVIVKIKASHKAFCEGDTLNFDELQRLGKQFSIYQNKQLFPNSINEIKDITKIGRAHV